MKGKIVEISGESRHLALSRGFIAVRDGDTKLGKVDLDNILSLIICSRGATVTNAVIAECASRNIPVFVCNSHYQPVAMVTPLEHHFDQHRRYVAQVQMKKGIRNQLWKSIVKSKIANQAAALDSISSPLGQRLRRIGAGVKPGDPENREAQAAQIYWREFFGSSFRRNREQEGINALLNYGYAIIRTAMTKAILGTGLHPSFGIHHRNQNNAFCLVDDLMEPYRPLVDQLVKQMADAGDAALHPASKAQLARLVAADTVSLGVTSPLGVQMLRFAQSVLENIDGNKVDLATPRIFTPLELASLVSTC